MKFFAVTTSAKVVSIEADSIFEALDIEPPNIQWMFSRKDLEAFIAEAQEALNEV